MKEEILQKLLKKIIPDFAGQGSEKLVDLLYNKQNVNEFLIAKKMELTINQTRNILYKLADEGLVGFIRKKDKKKGGWYTYFWTLRAKKSLLKYKEDKVEKVEKLETQLKKRETEHHYYCKNCDLEYTEENAMLQEYTCIECGEVLEIREIEKITNHLKNEIKNLEENLIQINIELESLEAKEEKSKTRKLKVEQKKKELERKKRRLEREKERAKEAKRLGKPLKKKVKKKAKKKKTKKKAKKKPARKKKKRSKTKKKTEKKALKKSPKKKIKKTSKAKKRKKR